MEHLTRDLYLDLGNHEEMRGNYDVADKYRRLAVNLPSKAGTQSQYQGADSVRHSTRTYQRFHRV